MAALLGRRRAPGASSTDRCALFLAAALLRFPARLQSLAVTGLTVIFFLGGEILLEILYRASGLADEPAEISCHGRQLAGTEDDQEEEPYDDHLLGTDTKHEA